MILVDTCIWSQALRGRRYPGEEKPPEVLELRRLIEEGEELGLPGIVLQELLSGLRDNAQFEALRKAVEGFPKILATEQSHTEAARIANACRRSGVTASTVDCLIAAMAIEVDAYLFTTDQDFYRIAENCALQVHSGPQETPFRD